VLLTCNDAIAKLLVSGYPVAQILCIHAACAVTLLLGLGALRGDLRSLRVVNWRLHVLRSGLYAAASFAFVTALRHLPLADTVALAFASPIVIAAIAPFVLREAVERWRWITILVGFAGILVMLRPGTGGMHWAMLLPVFVAVADGVRDMVTRRMTGGETTYAILLMTAATMVAVSLPLALAGDWSPVPAGDLVLFAAGAALFVGAHYAMIEAYRRGETVAVAPFRFMQIIWSIAAGYILWRDVPDAFMLVGAALTIASGLYFVWRETRRARG
jgi:drug/metabolite transporter (DMT)-like permease